MCGIPRAGGSAAAIKAHLARHLGTLEEDCARTASSLGSSLSVISALKLNGCGMPSWLRRICSLQNLSPLPAMSISPPELRHDGHLESATSLLNQSAPWLRLCWPTPDLNSRWRELDLQCGLPFALEKQFIETCHFVQMPMSSSSTRPLLVQADSFSHTDWDRNCSTYVVTCLAI